MKWIDLTDIHAYNPVSEIIIAENNLDLHNDFNVLRIEYSSFDHYLAVYFESNITYSVLLFQKSTVCSWKMLSAQDSSPEVRAFEFFQRVFGVMDAEGFWTQLSNNRKFFLIEFTDESEILLDAERVVFVDLGIETILEQRRRDLEMQTLAYSMKELEAVLAQTGNHGATSLKEHLQRRLDNRRELYRQKAMYHELDRQRRTAIREHHLLLTGCF